MRKTTWKATTERVEVHLVQEFVEGDNEQLIPHVNGYLMVGPVGGPLARVEGNDAELLAMLLTQIVRQVGYLPPRGGGGPLAR